MYTQIRSLVRTPLYLVLLFGASAVQAQTFVVSKTSDSQDGVCDADCSLREAISAANASAGSHTIRLAAETYVLSLPAEQDEEGDTLGEDDNRNGDLDVRGTLTIIGAGRQQTTISGSAEANDRILHVLPGARLTMKNLRLSGGQGSTYGGALYNQGETQLGNVEVSNNVSSGAFSAGSGGGISNAGTLNVYGSLLSGNRSAAGEGHYGAGGGIHNTGTLVVRDSTFSDNRASDDDDMGFGGAIHNSGQADIGRSTFVGNNAGYGSALNNQGNGRLTVFNSTVSANSLRYYPEGAVNNGNFTDRNGEKPYLQLTNVTIANNSGGYGLLNQGTVVLRNSLIAGNRGEYDGEFLECDNLNGGQYKAIGLLLGTAPGSCTADIYVDSATTFSKVLSALADNNGTTQTHALRKGSPAIDAGLGRCTSTDQRGLSRPRDGDGDGVAGCDLGAYERAYP